MKILGLSHPHSGCGFHRVVLPLGFMNDVSGFVTNIPTDDVLTQKWDILLFNRISQYDNNFDKVREQIGCKIVVDMDDDWILPSNHINYYDYQELNSRIEKNLRNADLVTCTHERLANRIRPFNSNVKVFPNAIPFGEHQYHDNKNNSDKVRIFWCGGVTHEGDMEILKNPIRKLKTHQHKIQMVIGGYDDSNDISKFIWDKMVSYFTASKQLPHEILKGTSPDKYMNMYSNADIMLVPLLSSDWSAGKSNLKLLEAATKKIPAICSAVEPYINDIDAPVFWVHNQTDWNKHLNLLINNPEIRKEYGEKIYQWAKRKYNIFDVNASRRKAFADLIAS
jgi:glycosyltransferase involved in cell wall biosynthesis